MTKAGWRRWIGAVAIGLGAQCAQAGTVWSVNGHEYEVITSEGITWTNAQAAVTLIGGGWHLATITSAGEDGFVAGLLPASPASRSHYWLGASDAAVEGTFAWVTGEAWSYTNWWAGEPNNSGEEDFLAYDFRTGWGWNDAADNLGSTYRFARGYVIERTGSGSVPLPGTLALLAFGFGLGLGGVALRRPRRG